VLEVHVLETFRRVLGQEHPYTIASISNLASTYREQGRWMEAGELFLQVIETRKKVLGQEHLDTLTSMGNLWGTMGSRWELRHLAGSPGGGGGVFKLCHTLIRVNTV